MVTFFLFYFSLSPSHSLQGNKIVTNVNGCCYTIASEMIISNAMVHISLRLFFLSLSFARQMKLLPGQSAFHLSCTHSRANERASISENPCNRSMRRPQGATQRPSWEMKFEKKTRHLSCEEKIILQSCVRWLHVFYICSSYSLTARQWKWNIKPFNWSSIKYIILSTKTHTHRLVTWFFVHCLPEPGSFLRDLFIIFMTTAYFLQPVDCISFSLHSLNFRCAVTFSLRHVSSTFALFLFSLLSLSPCVQHQQSVS